MPLVAGQTLGHYEILGPLGAGAMGVVYRARDTRLDREVAIKVLPDGLADDRERLARFEREAKTLASLNHPNVAQVFGIDQVGDTSFMAMELVPGEDLAARLSRGALPVDEAIDVCRQVAEGVEAAHEAGVIHRDLKPANVVITPEGRVKVLDFGLAKPTEAGRTGDSSNDSVLTTEEGRLLGTPTYMAPEQVRGKAIDKRVDVWAFGCVLYECLTAQRAFAGETLSDVLAVVLQEEPDWTRLPDAAPMQLRELLLRCFVKDPRGRLRDLGEARIALERVGAEPGVPSAGARTRLAGMAGWIAGAAILAALLLVLMLRPSAPAPVPRPAAHFVIDPELIAAGMIGGDQVAVSEDGRTIAYVGVPGDSRLLLRAVDSLDPTPVAGSEGARSPCFSPDGEWVAYRLRNGLWKAPTHGGSAALIAEAGVIEGIAWGAGGRIVVDEWQAGLLLVDADSGEIETLLAAEEAYVYSSPEFLPGGEAFCFEVGGNLAVMRLGDRTWRTLALAGRAPRWSPSGHVVHQCEDGRLWATAFDTERLEPTGEPFQVLDRPVLDFDLSAEGTLVYLPGVVFPENELVWVDRAGAATPLPFEPAHYYAPRLSPDETRLAVSITASQEVHLWLLELSRGSRSPLTTSGSYNAWPVWTHAGARVQFMHDGLGIYWKPADGSGTPQRLIQDPDLYGVPTSWSEAAETLAFYRYSDQGDLGLWYPDGEVLDFLVTDSDESAPQISPDGGWIAYVSDLSGIDEVYVRAHARGQAAGTRIPISSGGGDEPRWSRDGAELTYRKGTQLYAVRFDPGPPAVAHKPVFLFDGGYLRSPIGRGNANYDVAEDGRYLMVRATEEPVPLRVHVVQGWSDSLR